MSQRAHTAPDKGGGRPWVAHLPQGVRQDLQAAAVRGYPFETCGLLLGRPSAGGVDVLEAVPLRNLDRERARDRYELDPDGFLAADARARSRGWEVVGIWHSHPDHPAQPSTTDRRHAWQEYVYIIVSVHNGMVTGLRAWRLDAEDFVEVPMESPAAPLPEEASS